MSIDTSTSLSKEGREFWGLIDEPHVPAPPPEREFSNVAKELIFPYGMGVTGNPHILPPPPPTIHSTASLKGIFPYGHVELPRPIPMPNPARNEMFLADTGVLSRRKSRFRLQWRKARNIFAAIVRMRNSLTMTAKERKSSRQNHLFALATTRSLLRSFYPTAICTQLKHRRQRSKDISIMHDRYELPAQDASDVDRGSKMKLLRSRLAEWLELSNILALKSFRFCDTDRSGQVDFVEFHAYMKDELQVPFSSEELRAVFKLVSPSGEALTSKQWLSIFERIEKPNWGGYVCRKTCKYYASRDQYDPCIPEVRILPGTSVSPRAIKNGWVEVIVTEESSPLYLPLVDETSGELVLCPSGSADDPRFCVDINGESGLVERFRKEEVLKDGTTTTCTVRRLSGRKEEIPSGHLHVQCQTLPGWCVLGHCGRNTIWADAEDSTIFSSEYRTRFEERWTNRQRDSMGNAIVSTPNDLDTYNSRGFRDLSARRKPP